MMKWFALFLLAAIPLSAHAQNIAPLPATQHVGKHHEKDQDRVARFNEILTHPQDTEKTAWEWYEFTNDTGWTVGGYNWAVVKWNQGFRTTALAYFDWLSTHCDDPDGTHEPEVCKQAKRNMK